MHLIRTQLLTMDSGGVELGIYPHDSDAFQTGEAQILKPKWRGKSRLSASSMGRQEERPDADRETDRCQKEVTRFSEQHGDPAPAGPPVNGFGLDIVYELDGQTALPVSLTTMCLITFHCGLFANSCSASGPFIPSPPSAADSHLQEQPCWHACDLTTVPGRIITPISLQ